MPNPVTAVSRILTYLMALGLAAGLALSLASFMQDWPADIITPFRLQFVALSLAALLLSLALRRKWLIGMAAAALVLNLVPISQRLLARQVLPATITAPARQVSLVFSNVLCDNRDFDGVITLARTENADLFAAAETTPKWLEHLSALDNLYPYRLAPHDEGVFGIALFAKRPFKGEIFPVGSHSMNLLRADFGDYVVYVAHPMPPATSTLSEDNRTYIEDLAARISLETKPVIMAGDLNSTLWSRNMRPLVSARLQWPSGSGLAHSWPTGNPLLGVQIDHVLTRGAMAGRYRILPPVGSDHFPVRADIALPSKG